MKRSILFLTLIALLALLVACGGNTPPPANTVENAPNETVVEEPVVEEPVVEEPVEEPVVEEPAVEEVAVAGPEALDAAFGAFIGGMTGYNTIDLETLNTLLVEEPPFLLDVRTVEEVEANGH